MIYKDTTGIMAIKIFRLYKDKTLTDKQLRKMTKDLLLEYESEKLEDKSKVIEKLQKDSEDLLTIKRILRG
jgi:hypothetical protein